MSHGDGGIPEEGIGNRLRPLAFVLLFGVVSGLVDFTYEGARSVIGPYLATLGASAALVGAITGLGEAVALVFRLVSGRWSDRSGRHWGLSITGYAITVVSVPTLGVAGTLSVVCLLVLAERLGKAVRTPARDTMLAAASADLGSGRTFALHEALDQSGALIGPLVVAGVLALHGGYRTGFAVLALPGVAALALLAYLRLRVPVPARYNPRPPSTPTTIVALRGFSRRYWQYAAFTAATMAGFSTFAVLAYHLQQSRVVPPPIVPVLYALAMGAAALAALASGHLYDRFGLRVLAALPLLAAAIPFLSFSTSAGLVCVGALLWGAAMGIHESTMRSAIADLVPPARRGTGYGTFTAVYGLAWLVGSTIIGVLYGIAIIDVIVFATAIQALALVLLIPLWPRAAAEPS